MIGMRMLLPVDLAFDEALSWLTDRLMARRLRVVRAFDLQETLPRPGGVPLPAPAGRALQLPYGHPAGIW